MILNTRDLELLGSLFTSSHPFFHYSSKNIYIISLHAFVLAARTKRGAHELDLYLSTKHDELLASTLEPGTYKKTSSLVIVDGFAVEITQDQANVLRSAKGVRVVEKNEELV
ncbi:hypothetical protein VIGAN_01044100 [Vigna angularis var. angularis]|uniref:Uncharacterized protein n=1 Tax=Vigna angularis var. angularis TaxID=157739 RepID=A0A0S3QXC8_PHAAN|nr:hypothetical protein VIGAN_01044100 [Vigna angularis var. angularis]